MQYKNSNKYGFSLVEVIFVAVLTTLVFGALLASFQYTLRLVNSYRSQLSVLSVANDRLEYIRSLPYNDVGTIAGIPSGLIPQNSTTSLNGIIFNERILVEYVDDPADGQDTATTSDSNGIPSDYKRVKLEYTWQMGGETNTFDLITNIVPRSIESTDGGGTVRVNVIDENSVLLPGASVRLINTTTTSTIDVTRIANASGVALISGAPAASGYELIVTANIGGRSYSTAQTYLATTSNPNPIVSPFAVLEADISTLTFQIGELSDLEIMTKSAIVEGNFLEEFNNLSGVATSSFVSIDGGELVLEDVAGVYENTGMVYLGPINPSPLLNWEKVRVAADLPAGTSYQVQFFTGSSTGPFTLIPNSELLGNNVGFSSNLINVSSLDVINYDEIYIGITLNTSDTSVTPEIDEIAIYYRESEVAIPNISFDINGDKIIGTDASSSPIYKYSDTLITNGSGEVTITNLEFDNYRVTLPASYDMAKACSNHPFVHLAGVDGKLEMVLVPNSPHTLRTVIVNSLGETIPGVNVTLTRPGYSESILTNSCGQAFFTGGLTSNNDYEISVTVAGYNNETITAFNIDNDVVSTIILTE